MAELDLAQIIDAYGRAASGLRSRLLLFLLGLFDSLGAYRDAQAAAFAHRVVPVVHGAQQKIGTLTAGYLSTLLAAQLGHKVAPVPVRAPDVARLRGVDPATLYQRPFTQIWTDLAGGTPFTDAVKHGRLRLVDIATTDAQLAKTHTAQRQLAEVADDDRVVGFRRVLQGDHSCGLCIVASTQRYHRAELLPIHPGCDCSVAPIVGDEDPGHIIDRATLAAAHAAIRERFGQDAPGARDIDYRKVLITHEHGEIGPVLGVLGQKFTGPDELHEGRPPRRTARAGSQGQRSRSAEPAAPAAADPVAELASAVKDIEAAQKAGKLEPTKLSGGSSADTRLAVLDDGRRAIYKQAPEWGDPDAPRTQADAEELGSAVARALGLPAPVVQRANREAVWIQYVPGPTGGELQDTAAGRERFRQMIDGRQGQLIGLLDILIINGDRNDGNFIVGDGDQLVPYDHGFAWQNGGDRPDPREFGPQGDRPVAHYITADYGWADNPLTAADIAESRRRLISLRGQFAKRRRADWLKKSLVILDELAKHATGTESILALDATRRAR